MNADVKEPAVALAQSILSDEAVRGVAKQTGLSFTSDQNELVEFRARLDMAQTSPGSLRVNYKDTDKKVSAAVANAVANTLVAWMPAPVAAAGTSALAGQGGPKAKHASEKSRRRHALHSRSTAQHDQTASGAADVSPSLNPVAGQIWERPFTLVRLAGDAGASQSESGFLWWPLVGILCGLLCLAGEFWPKESAAPLEPPVLKNRSRAEEAPEYAGSFIHMEDHWAQEVLKSLSHTDIAHEVEVVAAGDKLLAVDSRRQVDCFVPALLERAHEDEVQPSAYADYLRSRWSLLPGCDQDIHPIPGTHTKP